MQSGQPQGLSCAEPGAACYSSTAHPTLTGTGTGSPESKKKEQEEESKTARAKRPVLRCRVRKFDTEHCSV